MKLKKSISLVLISCSILTSCGKNSNKYEFKYAEGVTNTYSAEVYYEDSYFDYEGSEYNPSLSTCSMALSMAAFNGETADDGYDFRFVNAENFLKNYGFSSIYANDGYNSKPTSTSVGIIIGQKKVNNKTLLAVAIRGKNYETEWVNNIKFGDGKTVLGHQGFFEASNEYLKTLENYISKYNVSGEIKLWSVGFSRGGAINNIALGQIDKMISKNTSLFNSKVTLQKEDVYGYCFSSPKGVSSKEEISPKDNIYSNIHNIINCNDIYTKIGFKEFDFTSYGVDYYLPDSMRNKDYDKLITKMKNAYETLEYSKENGEYSVDDFSLNHEEQSSYSVIEGNNVSVNSNVGLYLDDLLECIAVFGIQSQENYYQTYQEALSELFEVIFKNGTPKFTFKTLAMNLVRYLISSSNVDVMINNLLKDPASFSNDFIVLLRSNLVSLGLEIKPEVLMNSLKSFVTMAISIFTLMSSSFTPLFNSSNISAILESTTPEVTLAHLMALDPNYNSSIIDYNYDGSYYCLDVTNVSSESKVVIYDEDNNEVGKLENGEIDATLSLTGGNYGNIVYFYLPVEQEYSIEISNVSSYSLTYFDQTNLSTNLNPYSSGDVGYYFKTSTTTYPEKNK